MNFNIFLIKNFHDIEFIPFSLSFSFFSFSNYSTTVQVVKIDSFQAQRTIDCKKVCCYIINFKRKGKKGHKKFELAECIYIEI